MCNIFIVDLGQINLCDSQTIENFAKLSGPAEVTKHTDELIKVDHNVNPSQDQCEQNIVFPVHHDQNFVAPKRRGRPFKESKLIAANPSQVEVLYPSKNQKNVDGMLEICFKFNNNHNTLFH